MLTKGSLVWKHSITDSPETSLIAFISVGAKSDPSLIHTPEAVLGGFVLRFIQVLDQPLLGSGGLAGLPKHPLLRAGQTLLLEMGKARALGSISIPVLDEGAYSCPALPCTAATSWLNSIVLLHSHS